MAFFQVLRSEKDNLFNDQMRAKVFDDFTTKESLDAIVHFKMPNKSIENDTQPQWFYNKKAILIIIIIFK